MLYSTHPFKWFICSSIWNWIAYANEAISVKKNTSCDKKATDERFYLGSTSILSTMVRTLLKIRKGLTAGGEGWNVVGVGGCCLTVKKPRSHLSRFTLRVDIFDEYRCSSTCYIVFQVTSGVSILTVHTFFRFLHWGTYILLDVMLCSVAECFYQLCRILTKILSDTTQENV